MSTRIPNVLNKSLRFQPLRYRLANHNTHVRFNQTSTKSPIASSSRINRYLPRLQALSTRTGVPLSSLAVSFMILHELTAVLPVIGFYFLFSSLGTGLGIIQWLNLTTTPDQEDVRDGGAVNENEVGSTSGWRSIVKGWYDEGEAKMGRVGKRYGIWQDGSESESESGMMRKGTAGEGIANAVAAYVVVKALLPVRIGVSIGAAPVFARWALEPVRRLGTKLIKRKGTGV